MNIRRTFEGRTAETTRCHSRRLESWVLKRELFAVEDLRQDFSVKFANGPSKSAEYGNGQMNEVPTNIAVACGEASAAGLMSSAEYELHC
jgi:hypothetical protein